MQTERHVKTLDSIHTSIKSLTESLSTSLGPKGCDKMIVSKELLITNDGATILKNFKYYHPINQLLQSVSEQMDTCCGDGTTSVVLLIGSIVNELSFLVHKNVRTTFLVKVLDEIKEDCLNYIDSVKFFMHDDQQSQNQNIKETNKRKLTTKNDQPAISKNSKPDAFSQTTLNSDDKVKLTGSNSQENSNQCEDGKFPTLEEYIQDFESMTVDELLAQCQTSEVKDITFNREFLLQSVNTALNSKVISQCLAEYAPIAVDACLNTKGNVSQIKITKQLGSMEDVCLKKSIILSKNIKNKVLKKDAKTFSKKGKIAVLQFCLSPPKPNLDYKVDVQDAESIMRIPHEEREYLINICQKIKKKNVDIVLIQKSLLRDSLSDLALNFLTKLDILAVDGLERDEISYICDVLKIPPSVESNSIECGEFTLLETDDNKIVTTEILTNDACSVIVKGSDSAILDEAERSLHDALCVVRCLLEEPYLVPGGGSIEAGISSMLSRKSDEILRIRLNNNLDSQFSESLSLNVSSNRLKENLLNKNNDEISSAKQSQFFAKSLVYERIAIAFSQIPYYLAYNAGMDATQTVSELLFRIRDEKTLGINSRIDDVSCMRAENVIQPAKISKHLVSLAIETAQTIIKIDDILPIKE